MSKGLPDPQKDFSNWYMQVVTRAGLADYGPVKGTMVIKPYGFQLWENIKNIFECLTLNILLTAQTRRATQSRNSMSHVIKSAEV